MNGGTINSSGVNGVRVSSVTYQDDILKGEYIQNGGEIISAMHGVVVGTSAIIKGGTITAAGSGYGIFFDSDMSLTIGEKDGIVSITSPEINGGIFQANQSSKIYFYDGIPDIALYKGLISECENFIQVVNKYKYLFGLCNGREEVESFTSRE
jgi:hypothetical protein